MKEKKKISKLQFSIFDKPKDSTISHPPKTCPVCKGKKQILDDNPKYQEPILVVCWYCKGK
jgi:hypothetical protein